MIFLCGINSLFWYILKELLTSVSVANAGYLRLSLLYLLVYWSVSSNYHGVHFAKKCSPMEPCFTTTITNKNSRMTDYN